MSKRIKYVKSEKGNLGFLVWWQSLDGRLEIKYYCKFSEAVKGFEGLKSLGRKPEIWRQVEIDSD